jgi:factor associated with neutral sphingomyelinase activation
MFGGRGAGRKRFSLLLLEEGEDYVADWEASCRWPAGVSGNWQGQPQLPGRLRLCSKSLFFEPEDTRVPIARCARIRTAQPADAL